MDISAVVAAVVVAATAGGSWFQGRKTGLGNALTTASDVVGMLAAQAGELRAQLAIKEAQIEQLRTRIETMERCGAPCERQGARHGQVLAARPEDPSDG